MRVRIAEDAALIRMDRREMLVEEGHEVVGEARDGAEAIALARELTPEAPIAHIEYANGLLLLYGDKKMDDAVEAYELAAELKPRDAMEKLDVELAKEELSE